MELVLCWKNEQSASNKKLRSSSENFQVTILISSLELHRLLWSPGGPTLLLLFHFMFAEGSVEFRFSHTISHWPLRDSVSSAKCVVIDHWPGFLIDLPESTSKGDKSYFLWGSHFPWFWNDKVWLNNNPPVTGLLKPLIFF